ncbi:triose-phosphate isomerase [Sandaracinobacter sp. RS1-74]|uniref:triose-phosphate isomerase n=1 Tax=Sandaracinobacteroides sayramensis TaxID=2913411 RepID=UPI001EDC77E5|nr:triose-phosphate isomerase [Sandaracinobacteroides sayramensis]MCG2839682.1 triose-phosphate isomerase [Sandaracinobacteroides sayramensis]
MEAMKLIAGNWKMNGLKAGAAELEALLAAEVPAGVELLLCPPATLVAAFAGLAEGSKLGIGAQDCHWEVSGAHTGDISAEMLADAGARDIIVGHSERRADHGETDAIVRRKAEAAHRAGCTPIVCVGETLAERDSGETLAVIARQLEGSVPEGIAGLVVAYEPVWAIGTGRTPTTEQVRQVHAAIAARMPAGTRILYGGSVKPANAAELLSVPHVHGALVGGASLKAADFLAIAAGAAT